MFSKFLAMFSNFSAMCLVTFQQCLATLQQCLVTFQQCLATFYQCLSTLSIFSYFEKKSGNRWMDRRTYPLIEMRGRISIKLCLTFFVLKFLGQKVCPLPKFEESFCFPPKIHETDSFICSHF